MTFTERGKKKNLRNILRSPKEGGDVAFTEHLNPAAVSPEEHSCLRGLLEMPKGVFTENCLIVIAVFDCGFVVTVVRIFLL